MTNNKFKEIKPIVIIKQELSESRKLELALIGCNAIDLICDGTNINERILIMHSLVKEFEKLTGAKL